MVIELSLEDLEPKESALVPDAYAAPSDIEWRICEIAFHAGCLKYTGVTDDEFYYDAWLYDNIENLLFVERGGV